MTGGEWAFAIGCINLLLVCVAIGESHRRRHKAKVQPTLTSTGDSVSNPMPHGLVRPPPPPTPPPVPGRAARP